MDGVLLPPTQYRPGQYRPVPASTGQYGMASSGHGLRLLDVSHGLRLLDVSHGPRWSMPAVVYAPGGLCPRWSMPAVFNARGVISSRVSVFPLGLEPGAPLQVPALRFP